MRDGIFLIWAYSSIESTLIQATAFQTVSPTLGCESGVFAAGSYGTEVNRLYSCGLCCGVREGEMVSIKEEGISEPTG